MNLEVITYQIWRELKIPNENVIVTTSKSKTWSKGLSPFFLGPCKTYDGLMAKNVENAWQYAKVYSEHLDENNEILPEYYEWRNKGWNSSYASRYPMGKGKIPKFSLWDGKRLSYIEARKNIYIPLYYKAVKNTESFQKLKGIYDSYKSQNKDLYLIDFDAYRHKELQMKYKDVINNPNKKMGHAFVLAMMLEIPEKLEKAISKI